MAATAQDILDVINKYDWPQYIEAIAPKNNRENILIINDILKNRVNVGLSMQSLNFETLTDIKRRNWTTEQYVDFIKEIEKRGKSPASEIIIPLKLICFLITSSIITFECVHTFFSS